KEGDMLLRNRSTGALELYDISNNQITAAFSLGTIGLDWQFAGVAPIHAPGASDLVLRNVNTGAFEVYDIGDLLPPSPPAENTTARQDQTEKASTGDREPDRPCCA